MTDRIDNSSLAETLATSLGAGTSFTYYHVSTPPTSCSSIYTPPPGSKPDRTYSESHTLLVTAKSNHTPKSNHDEEVTVYAIELILYTTAHLSTLFVSKADSTGYAHLISAHGGAGSVIRSITSTFISWLIKHRHRADRRLVLSLFARAQGQYLFPGSVDNGKKHVLDDRQLVKWWCKTLDPVVREYGLDTGSEQDKPASLETRSKAYLIVPGHDTHETSSFFPPSSHLDAPQQKRWVNTHPLSLISPHPHAPPRSLIPHFPDDPKARFLLDLDEEIPDSAMSQSSGGSFPISPTKRGAGVWKSVKTIEAFWEMMAFRQECSSGRLVGFIWITFTPGGLESQRTKNTIGHEASLTISPTPAKRRAPSSSTSAKPAVQRKSNKQSLLRGPILPRAPRAKSSTSASTSTSTPETTKHYHAPATSRGTLVLSEKDYARIHEMLLRLDFSSLELSCNSTRTWIQETGVVAGVKRPDWGVQIHGTRKVEPGPAQSAAGSTGMSGSTNGTNGTKDVNVLVVKRRPKRDVDAADLGAATAVQTPTTVPASVAGVTSLNASLVRKKPKV